MLRADSAGSPRRSFASRPEIRIALTGRTAAGDAPQRHARRGSPVQRRSGDRLRVGSPAPSASRRASAPCTTASAAACSRSPRSAPPRSASASCSRGSSPTRSRGRCASSPQTARRVEEGDLEARAEVTGATEQREVTIAFNDMTERIGTVLAAQREFVSNASHQLRTPLTGLRLRLESAVREGRQPELERELAAARAGGRPARAPAEHAAHARPGGTDPGHGPARLARPRVEARPRALGGPLRAASASGSGSSRARTWSRSRSRKTSRSSSTT